MRALEQKYFKEMEDTYSQVRKRMVYLIPLNLGLCYAIFRFPRLIKGFTQKYLIRGRKQSMKTLLPVSVALSIIMTGSLLGLNCAVLGINPFKMAS